MTDVFDKQQERLSKQEEISGKYIEKVERQQRKLKKLTEELEGQKTISKVQNILLQKRKITIKKQAEEIERLREELKHCEWRKGYTDQSSKPVKRPVVESRLYGDEEQVRETRLVKRGELSPMIPGTTVTRIIGACPRCNNLKAWGHTKDCKIAAALAEKPRTGAGKPEAAHD